MQASHTIDEQRQRQMQVQERWMPAPSQLELELHCRVLEINSRLEIERCEAYRRMIFAMAAGGYPQAGQPPLPLPGPVLIPQRQLMLPVPVGPYSPSLVAQAPEGPVLHGTVAARAAYQWGRHPTLPSPSTPSGPSSRLSDSPSGRGRGRGRGRGGRGRGRGGRAGATTSLTQRRLIDAEPSPRTNALNHCDELWRTGDGPTSRNTTSATSSPQPQTLRKLFRYSLTNGIPSGPRIDLLSARLCAASGRFESRAAVDLFLRENGIDPSSQLPPQDAALADATPNVTPARFRALFGGHPQHERPQSRERNIICINPVLQPYAPSAPGQPGVLFVVPGSPLFEDDHQTFRVFTNASTRDTPLKEMQCVYLGDYSRVPIANTSIEVEDWLSLPIRCRAQWSWRILTSISPKIRAFRAKIVICDARPGGPPASQGEIDAWLKDHPGQGHREGIKESIIFDALDSGKEKMDLKVVKCVGYSIGVSLKIQG